MLKMAKDSETETFELSFLCAGKLFEFSDRDTNSSDMEGKMNIESWISRSAQKAQTGYQTAQVTKRQEKTDPAFGALLRDTGMKCPYSSMAKDGVIVYNGVTFVCDYRTNSITLGDMSDPKKVLNISLSSGGTLRVNVNNFDDLGKAAGMFTPEDLNAILRAIHQYNHCTSKLNEAEEEEEEGLASCKQEIRRRILEHEAEKKFQIGNKEYSLREWDKLMENFDEAQEEIQEEQKLRLEEQKRRLKQKEQKQEREQETYLKTLAQY